MEYKKLGDICDIASGGTPLRSKLEYWSDGTIPWLKITNIKEKYISKANEYITQSGLDNSSAKMFSKGTVLYTIFATLGEVGILDFEASTNQAIAGIKVKDDDKLNREYLYYFLKSKKNYVNGIGRGVAQNNINMSILRNFKIPLPNLSVQNKIVNVLNRVSNVIEWRKNQISKYDELIKARFVEMFGNVKNKEKYKGIALKNICKTMSGGTPSTKNPEYYSGQIPWITTISLGENYIDGNNAKGYITQQAIDNSATKLVPKDSILFGTRVGVGKSSINEVEMCTNQDIVAIINVDKSKYNNLFIKNVLDAYQPYYDSLKKGATILGITSDDLKNTLIPIVPLNLQNQFADFVKQIDKSKFVVQKSLDKAQLLFDSLMQEYFG